MIPIVDESTAPSISSVHPDIIQTHIFTRLDGPTLASAACASSNLLSLSSDDALWRQICHATWPSTAHPRVRHVITSFRSFYSDSFPALLHTITRRPDPCPPLSELISAVDLSFENTPILSRVQHTETNTGWFLGSPFRVDVLDPKETVQMTAVQAGLDSCLLEQSLSLSWIMVDPNGGRAANFSSARPVSVARHWLTGDLHVRFAVIMRGREEGQHVQCAAVVTCKKNEAGEVHVREVSFVVEDMEGRSLSGEESLVILQGAMERGERRRRRRREDGDEERERYEEFVEMKRERRERKEMKEKRMDMVCVFTVVALLVTWGIFLIKISS